MERWHTEAEYGIDLNPDTDLEPFGQYATEVRYNRDDAILNLATRLTATSHQDAAAEAQDWLARVGRHLTAAGHPGTPIRHTVQTQASRARNYASGTAEAASLIGLNISQPPPSR